MCDAFADPSLRSRMTAKARWQRMRPKDLGGRIWNPPLRNERNAHRERLIVRERPIHRMRSPFPRRGRQMEALGESRIQQKAENAMRFPPF